MKTTLLWPASDMVAEGARQEVYHQLVNNGWDGEDFDDEEDFDLNVTFPGWNKEDSFAILAGMLEDAAFDFPHFGHMERSSLDSELILRLHEEHTSPPIFPITAQGLLVNIELPLTNFAVRIQLI